MTETRLGKYNLVAVYSSMEDARTGMESLERGGVDGSAISLLGPGAEEAQETTDTSERDARLASHVGKRAAAGAAVGATGGGLVGLLAGAAAFTIPGVGPVIGVGIWAAAVGGAVAGGGVGGVVGGMSSLEMGEFSELTHESVKAGQVCIGIHTHDEAVLMNAEEALSDTNPLMTRRFDEKGRRLTGKP